MFYPLLIAFSAGFFSLFSVRIMFFKDESTYSAIFSVLIALIIIACLGIYYRSRSQTDLRKAGDNIYYLGLLFTLLSLCFALVQLFLLQQDNDELRRRTHELIGNFGIALISTMVGILGHILFQDLSYERNDRQPERQFGEALPSVSESVLTLRQKLREAVDAFSHFTRITQSQAEQVKVHSEQLISEFNARMSTEAERGLSEVMVSWRKSLQSITAESNESVQSMRGKLRGIVSETAVLSTKIVDTNRDIKLLTGSLDAVKKSTESVTASTTEAMSRLDDLASAASRASEMLTSHTTEFLHQLTQYEASVVTFTKSSRDQLEQDGARWLKSVTTITEITEARLQKAIGNAEAVGALGEAISKEADQSLAVIQKMRESLAAVSVTREQRRSISTSRTRWGIGIIWNKMKRLARRI